MDQISLPLPPSPPTIVASTVGLALLASFVAGNAALSYIAIPCLLMPATQSSSENTTQAANRKSPAAASDLLLSRQWHLLYERGKSAGVPLAVLAAASLLYATLNMTESEVVSRRLHYVAMVCGVGVVPYTIAVMLPTNNELMKRAQQQDNEKHAGMLSAEGGSGRGEGEQPRLGYHATASTRELVSWWNTMNKFRALLSAVGFGCVLAAIALDAH